MSSIAAMLSATILERVTCLRKMWHCWRRDGRQSRFANNFCQEPNWNRQKMTARRHRLRRTDESIRYLNTRKTCDLWYQVDSGAKKMAYERWTGVVLKMSEQMMTIDFITFNSSLVPLIEGLCNSNPWKFELSGFRRNRTDDLGINSPLLGPTDPRLHVRSE